MGLQHAGLVAELVPARGDVVAEPLLEDRPVEGLGARPQGLAIEPRLGPLESRDRVDQRVDRLLREEDGGRRRVGGVEPDHRLERAAPRERDRRASGRGRFERRDAEVLDRRKDEGAAARVQPGDLGVGPPPEKAHRRPGQRAQPRLLRARADDDEPSAEAIGRADREVDALVRHERTHDQIVVVGGLGDLETPHVDRRIDHVGRPVVGSADPVGDVPRDRDEPVHAAGVRSQRRRTAATVGPSTRAATDRGPARSSRPTGPRHTASEKSNSTDGAHAAARGRSWRRSGSSTGRDRSR